MITKVYMNLPDKSAEGGTRRSYLDEEQVFENVGVLFDHFLENDGIELSTDQKEEYFVKLKPQLDDFLAGLNQSGAEHPLRHVGIVFYEAWKDMAVADGILVVEEQKSEDSQERAQSAARLSTVASSLSAFKNKATESARGAVRRASTTAVGAGALKLMSKASASVVQAKLARKGSVVRENLQAKTMPTADLEQQQFLALVDIFLTKPERLAEVKATSRDKKVQEELKTTAALEELAPMSTTQQAEMTEEERGRESIVYQLEKEIGNISNIKLFAVERAELILAARDASEYERTSPKGRKS